MLLLVRHADDVPSAIRAASEFLVYQRQRCGARGRDEILGIWLTRTLEAGLPAWLSVNAARAEGMAGDPGTSQIGEAGATDAPVGIRASYSLSGVWTLCQMDGSLWRRATTSGARREAILRTLAQAVSTSSVAPAECGPFFPVFRADERTERVDAALRHLRARYPDLIGARWFFDDTERGIVAPDPSMDATP